MNILLILLLSLGLIIFFKTKSRAKRVSIYNKINESDKNQDKIEVNNQDKNLSNFISIPFFLEKVIYFKIIIFVAILMITSILWTIDIITISFENSLIIGLTILITTLYLPKIVIKNIITKKIDSVLKSLPFFIDITAACVQSGMTIDSALSYTAKKFTLINSDLSRMILKMTKRAEINGLESAIREFHQCSSATEIKMFCSALQYSISFGSSVYEQLIKLSQDIREMQLLVTEEKISKLSAKLTFPLFLFILIPFIVLVISPSILEILTYV